MIPRESIQAVLEYLEPDESADFAAEFGNPSDTDPDPDCTHIYSHMVRIRTWLEGMTEEITQEQIDEIARLTGVYL